MSNPKLMLRTTMDDLTRLGEYIHDRAKRKGFWDTERNDGEMIALIHSELSEALEALRVGNPESTAIRGYSAIEEEIADVMIRILDMCAGRGWRLFDAINAKMAYNEGRAYRHGKRF